MSKLKLDMESKKDFLEFIKKNSKDKNIQNTINNKPEVREKVVSMIKDFALDNDSLISSFKENKKSGNNRDNKSIIQDMKDNKQFLEEMFGKENMKNVLTERSIRISKDKLDNFVQKLQDPNGFEFEDKVKENSKEKYMDKKNNKIQKLQDIQKEYNKKLNEIFYMGIQKEMTENPGKEVKKENLLKTVDNILKSSVVLEDLKSLNKCKKEISSDMKNLIDSLDFNKDRKQESSMDIKLE